jgi:hypothetical protein
MPIDWPQTLVTEIAERRCIIFMGAGVSMGSLGEDHVTRPPNWETFLRRAAELPPAEPDKRLVKALINKYQFLDAAEIILDRSNHADFSEFLRAILVQRVIALRISLTLSKLLKNRRLDFSGQSLSLLFLINPQRISILHSFCTQRRGFSVARCNVLLQSVCSENVRTLKSVER